MTAAGAALGLSGLVPLGAFTWGVQGHFRRTGPLPAGMRAISLLSIAAFLWFVWRLWLAPPAAAWPVAAVLFAASLGLFAWCVGSTRGQRPTLAFSADIPSFLVRTGPFRLVRHPFYLSYLLFWFGTALATSGPWGWFAPVVMAALYGDAAVLEERKFARSPLATDYARYRRVAGMFLPRWRRDASP